MITAKSAIFGVLGGALLVSSAMIASSPGLEIVVEKNGRNVSSRASVTVVGGPKRMAAERRGGQLFITTWVQSQVEPVEILVRLDGELLKAQVQPYLWSTSKWTVILADLGYGVDHNWLVPKGAKIRRSCIVAFESLDGDGVETFYPNCRNKRR